MVALLLDRNPDLIAAKDRRGQTALHWAAENGHKDVVALLLDRNPDLITIKNKNKSDDITLGGDARAQGRGQGAVGRHGGSRRCREG